MTAREARPKKLPSSDEEGKSRLRLVGWLS